MKWDGSGRWLVINAGFSDFAGSTLVHAAGGVCLAGAMVLGARSGRFTSGGGVKAMAPFAASSIPLATLGVFILC